MREDFGKGRHIVARKRHRCEACFGPIEKGERYYRYSGSFRGDLQYWGMHEECYEAFAKSGDDEFAPGDFPVPERVKAQQSTVTIQ